MKNLPQTSSTWLVTGAAGFIGSNLVETLLRLGQTVVGLDDFSTGKRINLEDVRAQVGPEAFARFRFIEADITDARACKQACAGAHYVLHQAALGSVPRSIHDPLTTHRSNVDGFFNMLDAAREAGVRRLIFASSSAVYGDDPELPKHENKIGQPLSPYALTKLMDEQYAAIYARCYGFESVGLRYFNVFGRRQDPQGDYAAVISKWVGALLAGQRCKIFGDGETSRDFCYVANVVQANLLAATVQTPGAANQVYNVACGERTTLNELFFQIRDGLAPKHPHLKDAQPEYGPFREGDIRHSLADISLVRERLGYAPTHTLAQGLAETLDWYSAHAGQVR